MRSEIYIDEIEKAEEKEFIPVTFMDIREAVNYANRKTRKTRVILRKIKQGDIIAPIIAADHHQFYMIKEDLPENIWLKNVVVIRATEIALEYLYMYLLSERVKNYFDYMDFTLQINQAMIGSMSIICPCEEMVIQAKMIYKYAFCHSDISLADEINTILQLGNTIPQEKTLQKLIDNELQEKLKMYKIEIVSELINSDMSKLEKCYEVGAYKACIIICGSILETVMLDWISEKENSDYFVNGEFVQLKRIINKIAKL